MPFLEPIKIEGLRDRRSELRGLGDGAQKKLRLVFNGAADRVVADAQRLVPTRSGRARRSIRARSTQASARVMGGGARVAYYPWLDFGGRVGRNRSTARPFLKDGRYIYPTFRANRAQVFADLEEGLRDLIRESGLEE